MCKNKYQTWSKSMKHLHSLTWKLVYFTANVAVVFGQGNEKAASTCEGENSFGVLMFKACFTEAQQLLRIENLLKDITVIPRNSTCGNPPSNYCRLVNFHTTFSVL